MAVTSGPVSDRLLAGGRYRLDDRLAAGGMGEVWQGTDLLLDRLVAVKLLRSAYADDKEHLARFRAEARHAGSLSHPGVAQVYDYCDDDPPHPPYLVMELVDGPSLARLLTKGPLDPARTMDLIAQAARALQAAHAAGLIHRDIKPGNLLVSRSGRLKITDFGIAHATGSAPLTRPGALIGTPAYMAPERSVGAPAMPAADLYALGIVAFQCLAGKLPFNGEPLAVVLAHQEQPLPQLPPSVSAGVAALVADLAAKDPRARPVSAGVVAERAERLRASLTATVNNQLARRRADGHPGRRALAVTAVAAIAAAAWLVTNMHGPMPGHPQPSPPAAGRQSGPHANHPADRALSHGRTSTGTVEAPSQNHRSAASHRSLGSDTVSEGTPPPSAAPSRSTTASSTPTATKSPTASSTPTPSGTLSGWPRNIRSKNVWRPVAEWALPSGRP